MSRGRKIIKSIDYEQCEMRVAMEEFFRHNAVKGLAKDTQNAYKSYIGLFCEWYGAENYVNDISAKTIDLYAYEKTKSGIKPISLASQMRHVRRFVNFCASRGYMEHVDVVIPKFEEELKEPYSEEEMKKLLKRPATDNWVEYRSWVMINYFFGTGQRLSTVINIKVCHLDLANSKVKLEHNKDKIKKWMPLSSALVKVLREYIVLSGLEEQDYLFPEYEGGQLARRSAEDAIAKYNRSRGVEKIGIHLFRHTFAKTYIMNGGNPVKLQKLLNHKTIDMTMRYVKLYGDDISADLDMYNPLDNFKRKNYTPTKRTKVMGV